MRRNVLLIVLLTLGAAFSASAADNKHMFSIAEAMETNAFKDRLNPSMKFFFGDQSYPQPLKVVGERVTNRKSNAIGKSDREACEWVLLSALLSLQERAFADGGNAVVDIQSYYKKNVVSSATEYECHTGNIIVGVALKGRVVTLP